MKKSKISKEALFFMMIGLAIVILVLVKVLFF